VDLLPNVVHLGNHPVGGLLELVTVQLLALRKPGGMAI
jgi:hypothetical protein